MGVKEGIDLNDPSAIFSKEEIEARKKELKELQLQKLQEALNLKEKMIEERKKLKDLGLARIIKSAEEAIQEEIEQIEEIPPEAEEIIEEQKSMLKEAKEAIEQTLEKIESGKVICPICAKEFSPQGFPKHHEACLKKKELEEQKRKLEEELLKLQGEQ